MVLTLFYFVLALMLLIFVHEYGHFIVARCCQVKVLRFSFGFGKVLASWHGKHGTEYAISLFPLGGYVKMLDESEGEVLKEERHLAFNNKPVWMRMAIVLAGPLFNLLFAFVALWLMLVIGIQSLAPIIAEVKPGSIAYQMGLTSQEEIISLDSQKIESWRDFQYVLMPLLGTTDPVPMTVRSLLNHEQKTLLFPVGKWHLDVKKPDLLDGFGILPFVPSIPPIVGEVMKESPAQMAGLQVGDRIVALNDQKINDWLDLVDFVRQHPKQSLTLTIKRHNKTMHILINAIGESVDGKKEGYLGVRSQKMDWPKGWLRLKQETPIHAIPIAFGETLMLTKASFVLIGRLVMGQLPIQSISGPVGIARGAGESGRSGLSYYLSFLAVVSISLGVLNILPIPMLDGGHLLYYLIEIVRRRPLSEGLKTMGTYLGLGLLFTLMVIALHNDILGLT